MAAGPSMVWGLIVGDAVLSLVVAVVVLDGDLGGVCRVFGVLSLSRPPLLGLDSIFRGCAS